MWSIHLPLAVPVSSKKDFPLNLNHYRNAHFQVLHKAKVRFEDMVSPFLRDLPRMDACSIEYILYPPSKGRYDTSNVCSIVDKFFSDTLVNAGLIPDDNYNVVVSVSYRFGEVDKNDPRVEAIITPIEPKEKVMQVILVQAEIEQALTDFISSQMTIKEGMAIKIELRATRGAEGFQASIDIIPENQLGQPAAAPLQTAVATPAATPKAKATVETEVKKSLEEAPRVVSGEVLPKETQSQPEPDDVGTAAVAETGSEPEAETPEAEPVPEAEPEAVAEEAAPAPEPSTKARSLFAGLAKPVNA